DQSKLEARTKELEASQSPVEQKIASLTESIAKEAGQAVDDPSGDIAKRRSQLETELAETKQAQSRLREQLDEVQRQLKAIKETYFAEQTRLEGRIKGLQTAQAQAVQQVKELSDNLAEESKRREGAEQKVDEVDQQRSELEAQLEMMLQQLETTQNQLKAEQESASAEKPRTRELQTKQTELERHIKQLTEALAEEKRGKAAEQQPSERKSAFSAVRDFVGDKLRSLMTRRRDVTSQLPAAPQVEAT